MKLVHICQSIIVQVMTKIRTMWNCFSFTKQKKRFKVS